MTFSIHSALLPLPSFQPPHTTIPAAVSSETIPGQFDYIIQTQKELKKQIAEKTVAIQEDTFTLEEISLKLSRQTSVHLSENISDERASSLLIENRQLKKKQKEFKSQIESNENFLKQCLDLLQKLNHEQSKVLLELKQKEKIILDKIEHQIVEVKREIESFQGKLKTCVANENVVELFQLRDKIRSYHEVLRKLEPFKKEHSSKLASYQELRRLFDPVEKFQSVLDFAKQFPNGVHVTTIISYQELDGKDVVQWNLKVVPPIKEKCRYIIWAPVIELGVMGWKLPVVISAIPDANSTQDPDDLLFDVTELYKKRKDFVIVGWNASLNC